MSETQDQTNLWGGYLDEIVGSNTGQLSNSSVIIGSTASYANLSLPLKTPEIEGNLYAIANVIPAWQPFYEATSIGFFQSYQLWIDSIYPKQDIDPDLQAQIDQATAALNATTFNLTDILTAAQKEYNIEKQYEPNLDWDDFLSTGQYGNQIDTAYANNDGAASALRTLMIQAYGAGYQELTQYQDAVKAADPLNPAHNPTYQMKVKDGYGTHYVPTFGFDATSYQNWVTDTTAKWQGGKTPNAFVYKYNKSTYSKSYSHWGWGGSFNIPLEDWFWVGGGTTGQKDTTTVSSYNFTGQVAFQDIYIMDITPGQWFDGSLEKFYAATTIPKVVVWGENGLLATQVTALIIGLGETIFIDWGESDWQEVYQYWKANASFGIGPFTLASASLSNKDDTYSSSQSGGSFTFKAINPKPRIIGYKVATPNYPPSSTSVQERYLTELDQLLQSH